MFYTNINESLDKEVIFYKKNNKWKGLTGKDILSLVEKISFSLYVNGLRYQDKIAILSNTSYKWSMCDYGIISMGAVTTTVYPSLMPDQIEFILNDSGSKLVFVEDQMQLEKIKSIFDSCKNLKKIIVMDNSFDGNETYIENFNSFLTSSRELIDSNEISFKDMVHKSKENDLLTLIYTSGTTGTPKGVMLSNKNIISNIISVSKLVPDIFQSSFLSFLPLSHVLERTVGHFLPMNLKSKIYYAENMETVGENMLEISPSVVICVPRFFEKMHDKILSGLKNANSIKRNLFSWALNVGKKHMTLVNANQKIPFFLKIKYSIANSLIYKKVRGRLGGQIKYFISGGAPLSQQVNEFFAAIGLTILEGYGLTETSPILTCNVPGNIQFGSVGMPIENVKIKIAEDGEILAKGPNIMLGYYNNKEATTEVFDNEGWFHTGDIGIVDKGGRLTITDRKKSIIVTSGGKNIAPAPLENSLLNSSYIEQVLVIGDNRNYLSCIIVPAFDNLKEFLSGLGKDASSNEAIIDYKETNNLFEKEVMNAMKDFSRFEQVKKFALISRNFMIEKGEMTPKMSIVRKVVESNFEDKINNLYKDGNND
tara:strand:+ start:177 stop:1961 length:1785 start_codon:yes stop_codon:yes gene_type:complete